MSIYQYPSPTLPYSENSEYEIRFNTVYVPSESLYLQGFGGSLSTSGL
jgi:hypothetical protein